MAGGRPRPDGLSLALRVVGLVIALLLTACAADETSQTPLAAPDAVAHVDPIIGTANEGNTFPGAVTPFGMVSVSPHNAYSTPLSYLVGESIAPSGYLHGEPHLFGFGFTHLSGVGCPDLGVPVVSATTGPLDVTEEGYRSAYTNEQAEPGYYSVVATDHGVTMEATATPRVGLLRFDFGAAGGGHVLVDPQRAVSWKRDEGAVTIADATSFEGSVTTGVFCAQPNAQTVYFAGRFNRAAAEHGVETGVSWFSFEGEAPVTLAVGISYTSLEGARANLSAEVGSPADFDAVRKAARDTWNDLLGRVRVEGASASDLTILYTALYHVLIHPSLFSDVGVTPARYHVYSLWDTYRTVHPLLNLVYPDLAEPILQSLVDLTLEWGAPPKWELAGQEVQMMVGDPAAIVFADAHARGLQFDLDAVYPILREKALDVDSSRLHRPGNASYRSLGYIPMEEAGDLWGPVSTTLEYAVADWAMARLAEALGRSEDVALFEAQAMSYANLFDPETGLLRPKMADGSWYEPFDPDSLQGSNDLYDPSGGPGFVEGTAWHYAFFVPHDMPGLIARHGGAESFGAVLSSVFDSGRFVMWNEPDIAYPWLFARIPGREGRALTEVRAAWEQFFGTGPDGLAGNDDAGTLSAWLVFAALGVYPDDPTGAAYTTIPALFDRVELHLPGADVRSYLGQRP